MAHRDIIVIGASAGGIQAVARLLQGLATDIPASVFVVVHTAPDGDGRLPFVLARGSDWKIAYAEDGDQFSPGSVYVAPADQHLLIRPGRVQVVRGPRENRFRPAVDPLFRSAAETYGSRVIGIVLSGSLNDGTHGLELIKRHGGLAIVQDPEEAMVAGMPLSAIQNVQVDHILPIAEIARQLPALVGKSVRTRPPRRKEVPDVAEGTVSNEIFRVGQLSELTCPECGGALRELEGGAVVRFRCHVGHGYTADSLIADQSAHLDNVFWSALRALEEHSMLRRRMAEDAEQGGRGAAAKLFEREARATELRASSIRHILLADPPVRSEGVPVRATSPARSGKRRPARPRSRRKNR